MFLTSDGLAWCSMVVAAVSAIFSGMAFMLSKRTERISLSTAFDCGLSIDPNSRALVPAAEEGYSEIENIRDLYASDLIMNLHVETYMAVKIKNLESARALAGLVAFISVENAERGWRIWKKRWLPYFSTALPDLQPLEIMESAATTYQPSQHPSFLEAFLVKVMPRTYETALPNFDRPETGKPIVSNPPPVKLLLNVTRRVVNKTTIIGTHRYWLEPCYAEPLNMPPRPHMLGGLEAWGGDEPASEKPHIPLLLYWRLRDADIPSPVTSR